MNSTHSFVERNKSEKEIDTEPKPKIKLRIRCKIYTKIIQVKIKI